MLLLYCLSILQFDKSFIVLWEEALDVMGQPRFPPFSLPAYEEKQAETEPDGIRVRKGALDLYVVNISRVCMDRWRD